MARKRKPRRFFKRTDRSDSIRQSKRLSFDQLESRHLLATLVVNSTADLPVDLTDSVVTLRDAIEAANNDVLVAPGGETGSGADTITFDVSVFVNVFGGATMINLTSELPTITDDVTIVGTAAEFLTINAGNGADGEFGTEDGFRIFSIDDGDNSNQINVTLSELTLTGGDLPFGTGDDVAGGAIFNRENFLLIDSTLSGNSAGSGGGIYNSSDGTLAVTDSRLSGNSVAFGFGGGIANAGEATVANSILSGNSANAGGGISNRGGAATITNSTLSGNSGLLSGGGIYNAASGELTVTGSTLSSNSANAGGGIANAGSSTVTITSSTLSGNSASDGGGGIDNFFGTLTVTGSTLSGNSADDGGGILSTGTATITNSTLSGNLANLSGGAIFNTGTATITSGTLSGNSASDGGGGIYNGVGFGTGTITLSSSIVANSTSGGDLRGIGSISGSFNLIGEGQNLSELTNTVTGDPLLGPLADNSGPTLTHALIPGSPAIDAGFSTELFDQRGEPFSRDNGRGVDIGAFELQATRPAQGLVVSTTQDSVDGDFSVGELSLREAIEIANESTGADTITFDASVFTGAQTINITSQLPSITEELTITGPGADLLTIDAGDGTDGQFGTGDGFGILLIDSGTLPVSLIDVTLSGLTLTGGDLSGNADGGAIFSYGNLGLDSVVISGNSVGGDGGGIFVSNFSGVSVTNSTILGNSAGDDGGGIFGGSATVTNSTISGNSASGDGGGILVSGIGAVTNSTISGNSASGNGGGILVSGIGTVTSSTISGNSAGGNGGGILASGIGTVTNSTISGNLASGNGGGIFNFNFATITSSTLSGNSASTGGGIYNSESFGTATISISNSIVANSTSGGDLGGSAPFTGSFNLIGDGQNLSALTGTVTGDPLLGPLAGNGGPTLTHTLLPGSPAIDVGDDDVTQTEDQRGLARNINGVDIGAFERQLDEPTGDLPSVTSFTRDGGGTLDTLDRPDLLSTISVSFGVDVSVSVDDLVIRNDTLGGSLVDTSGLTFNYNATTQTATWDFDSLTLDPAFYSFELSSDIVSVNGNLSLDGDADGNPGGAFTEPIYVAIPGDANLDGQVDVLGDAFELIANLGVTGGATFAQGDFNGDGDVDVLNDAFIVVNNLGQSVIPPTASQAVVPPAFAAVDSTPSLQSAAVIVEQAVESAEDEKHLVAAVPREVVKATSPELSGDQVRDDAFASEFGALDSFWV